MRPTPTLIAQLIVAALIAWLVNLSLNIGNRVSVIEVKIEMVQQQLQELTKWKQDLENSYNGK